MDKKCCNAIPMIEKGTGRKMWQTTRMTNSRTYKEIDKRQTVICIDDVEAVKLCGFNKRHRVDFSPATTYTQAKNLQPKKKQKIKQYIKR